LAFLQQVLGLHLGVQLLQSFQFHGASYITLTLDQGLCSWTLLGAPPQTPVIGSRSALDMVAPTSDPFHRLCLEHILFCILCFIVYDPE